MQCNGPMMRIVEWLMQRSNDENSGMVNAKAQC